MRKPHLAARPDDGSYDAGTLWRMTRNGWIARCALWSLADGWELRVTVEADILFSKRSSRVEDLFTHAER